MTDSHSSSSSDRHKQSIQRRQLIKTALAGSACLALRLSASGISESNTSIDLRRRIEGMLIGTLIGDAAGGPVEFKSPPEVKGILPGTRDWPDDRELNALEISKLARSFPLLSYEKLRPDPEPYAHWTENAAAGTITDDSRQKLILINTLRYAQARGAFPITARDLARQYVAFIHSPAVQSRPQYAGLCRANLKEFVKSAQWLLGKRDPEQALPPERMWAGVPTCAGQMALLPIGALYPGQPELAYRAAYHIGFIDNGTAKDLNAALVAGIATALSTSLNPPSPQIAWQEAIQSMKATDPYRYHDIPWVERPIQRWLDFAHSAATRAKHRPKQLFHILENEASPHYWWDAHFLIAVVFSLIDLCRFDALAALHLALDFGHDTDSAAQLIGAFAGALHGPDIFPEGMQKQVINQLHEDYGETFSDWVDLLVALPNTVKRTEVIRIE
jgi:ADP-ribosylglycohydrolase